MKKIFIALLILGVNYHVFSQTATAPSSGDGTEANPYQIATMENLYWLSQSDTVWSKYFIQTANIDTIGSSISTWDAGAGFSPIGNSTTNFRGYYDGNGHTIDGLYINRSSTNQVAFLGYTNGATVKNLGLTNITFSGDIASGGLIGYAKSTNVSECFVTGQLSAGNYSGGLIGGHYSSTTSTNCWADVDVISSGNGVGAYVGKINSGAITNAYSIGSVAGEGSNHGAFIGDFSGGTITASFCDTIASGSSTVIGSGTSDNLTGLTTAEMQTLATYADSAWNFGSTWWIDEGNDYPKLRAIEEPVSTTWNGASWDNGTPTVDAIIDGNLTTTGDITCQKITIGAAGSLEIDPAHTVTIEGFEIESDATGTGSILGNTNLAVTYTPTVQNYLGSYAKDLFWHYVSLPVDVSGGNITSSTFGTPYDNSGTDYYALYYDETVSDYVGITNNSTVLSEQMRGYAVPKNTTETIEFTGDLTDGTQSITLTNDNNGYNLIGNPYPSGVNLGNIDAGLTGITTTNLATTVWIRENGGFNEYNWQSGATVSGTFAGVIPPMQAAWFKVSEGKATGNLEFENTARVSNNETIYKSATNNLLRFSLSNGSGADNAAIGLYANATIAMDNYDSEKMFDNDASIPQVFMHIDNTDIAINGLPANQQELTVPIGIKTATDGDFTLSFSNISEIEMEYEIFLKDNLTGDIIDLRKNSEYEFYTSAINSTSRLSVIISKSSTGVEELANDFVIYYSDNSIIITANSGTQAVTSVYDVSGKVVSIENMNLVPGKNQIEINQPDGVYMVNIRNTNINITRKVVIR